MTCTTCDRPIIGREPRVCVVCGAVTCPAYRCGAEWSVPGFVTSPWLCPACRRHWREYATRMEALLEAQRIEQELLLAEWKGRAKQ